MKYYTKRDRNSRKTLSALFHSYVCYELINAYVSYANAPFLNLFPLAPQ